MLPTVSLHTVEATRNAVRGHGPGNPRTRRVTRHAWGQSRAPR